MHLLILIAGMALGAPIVTDIDGKGFFVAGKNLRRSSQSDQVFKNEVCIDSIFRACGIALRINPTDPSWPLVQDGWMEAKRNGFFVFFNAPMPDEAKIKCVKDEAVKCQ